MARANAILLQRLQCRAPNIVARDSGHILHIVALHGKTHSDVRLRTAVLSYESVSLTKSEAVGLREAEQYLSERNHLVFHTTTFSFTNVKVEKVIDNSKNINIICTNRCF